jgi:outer membrane scaffolding protein for murein synthesis (MipA/OmpV family)
MLRAEVFMVRVLLTAAVVLAAAPASAQEAVPFITPTLPNYVGFGLGVTPDYIGADDYFFGRLPLARYQFEGSDRYASLVGTFVDLNLINHLIIRFGPTAQLRFGRSNVSDRAVRRLPSIGKTIEAGVFGGLEFLAPSDPRKRLRLDLRFQQDLTSEHDGWLASSGVQGWYRSSGWPRSASRSARPMAAATTCRPSSASGRGIRRKAASRPSMPTPAFATSASPWASWSRSPSTGSARA